MCSVLVVYLDVLCIGLLKLVDRFVGEEGFDMFEDIFNLMLDECVVVGIGVLFVCFVV